MTFLFFMNIFFTYNCLLVNMVDWELTKMNYRQIGEQTGTNTYEVELLLKYLTCCGGKLHADMSTTIHT